jgi:hypothetical protein
VGSFDLDKATIKISEYCGDPPFVLAKPEAAKVVGVVVDELSSGTKAIRLDFENVQAISPSGARVLFAGLVQRYGGEIAGQLILSNVTPELVGILEDAFSDILQSTPKISPDVPHKTAS